MADYTAKKIGDMEAVFGGAFKRARAELGVSSFGMQVIDLPPNFEDYPEHDESEQGQEEVFVIMSGSAEIEVDGEKVAIDPETFIRVGPDARRKIVTGGQGARVLALGAVPGQPYDAPEVTQLGAPDPLAS